MKKEIKVPAHICNRCGMLDDPVRDLPCRCTAYRLATGVTTTWPDAQVRPRRFGGRVG